MKNIFLFISLLGLASCSSVINTPSARMISPEANGAFLKGSVDLRLAGTKRDHFEFQNNDPKKPFAEVDTTHKVGGLLDLGLVDRLDFIYLGHLSSTSSGILGLKGQVLGKTKDESKKGNFSLSLIAGAGGTSFDYDDLDNDVNDFFTNVEKLSADVEHYEGGLLLGYRSLDRLLHYANAVFFQENIRGKVTTDGNTLVDAKFKDSQEGMIYSTGIMYDLGANWGLKLDYTHMVSAWRSFRGSTTNTLSGAISAAW